MFTTMFARLGVLAFVGVLGLLTPCLALAGFSVDETPRETNLDPGDLFLPGGVCEVDDGDGNCTPGAPSLLVPNPSNFDLDAFTIDKAEEVCSQPTTHPGILFSFNDGDPGAGSGAPDNSTEMFFYDRCNVMNPAGGSFYTSMTESALGLGNNPPPRSHDDDVDAYETRSVAYWWNLHYGLLFSADTPSTGGLPGAAPIEGNIYRVVSGGGAPVVFRTPAQLGVPNTTSCNIDALARVYDSSNPSYWILFSTHRGESCGLDPGNIYVSNGAGSYWLYADKVKDLKIANDAADDVDIDAIAINTGGNFTVGDPYYPPTNYYKADWPNYAPNGMPDFQEDLQGWQPTQCGPVAVANSLWWFDSEQDCEKDRTKGDLAESEANDTCLTADALGEVPPIPGILAAAADADWYKFEVPYPGRGLCNVTVSTCALYQAGDADTKLSVYGTCGAAGPGDQKAVSDAGCAGGPAEDISLRLASGQSYWVKVEQGATGVAGGNYTLSVGLDCFPMVKRYGDPVKLVYTPDDHSSYNPKPLIEDLAWTMNTDDQQFPPPPLWKGTKVADMVTGIQNWLTAHGLAGNYGVQSVFGQGAAPSFDQVATWIKQSHDVVLFVNYYWQDPTTQPPSWFYCAGHFLTAAGVDTKNKTITVSDPALNNAEAGGKGRVLGPNHANHSSAYPPPPDHFDAQNASQDEYPIGASQTGFVPPYAQWSIPNYATLGPPAVTTCADIPACMRAEEVGKNPPPETHVGQPQALPCPANHPEYVVSAEVEAAVHVYPGITPICLKLSQTSPWPYNLGIDKGACAGPGTSLVAYDVVRGKLCDLGLSLLLPQVDLGHTTCLYNDLYQQNFDDAITPDKIDCAGGWFFVIRQTGDPDYGNNGAGRTRVPSSGGCP
jgi:hypothetical protein